MTPNDGRDSQELEHRVRELNHDLRNSLHVWEQGLHVLPHLRSDDAQFHNTLDILKEEQKQAAKFLNDLVALIRAHLGASN